MHAEIEMLTKCRRFFYDKQTGGPPEGSNNFNISSGGGAWKNFTGDNLIIATYNDETAPDRIGVIEHYHPPIGRVRIQKVDLACVDDYKHICGEFVACTTAETRLAHFSKMCEMRDHMCTFKNLNEGRVIDGYVPEDNNG